MKTKYWIVVMVLLYSCHNGYFIEHITFKDPIINVQDSLIQFEEMLDKIAFKDHDTNFYFGAQSLKINGKYIGSIALSTLNNYSLFSTFTPLEKQRFLKLITFLKENRINLASKNVRMRIWLFDYEKYKYVDWTKERTIIIYKNSVDTTGLGKYYVVTDRAKNLLLLAPSPKDLCLNELK